MSPTRWTDGSRSATRILRAVLIGARSTPGEPDTMSCFLRPEGGAGGQRWRQGRLRRDDRGRLTWWSGPPGRRRATPLPTLAVRHVRDVVAADDRSLKHELFAVVECSSANRRLDLAVPRRDVPTVRRWTDGRCDET